MVEMVVDIERSMSLGLFEGSGDGTVVLLLYGEWCVADGGGI